MLLRVLYCLQTKYGHLFNYKCLQLVVPAGMSLVQLSCFSDIFLEMFIYHIVFATLFQYSVTYICVAFLSEIYANSIQNILTPQNYQISVTNIKYFSLLSIYQGYIRVEKINLTKTSIIGNKGNSNPQYIISVAERFPNKCLLFPYMEYIHSRSSHTPQYIKFYIPKIKTNAIYILLPPIKSVYFKKAVYMNIRKNIVLAKINIFVLLY